MEKIIKYESQGWFWSIAHTKDFPYSVTIWKYLDWKSEPVKKGKPYNPQKLDVYMGVGKSIEEATTNLDENFAKGVNKRALLKFV